MSCFQICFDTMSMQGVYLYISFIISLYKSFILYAYPFWQRLSGNDLVSPKHRSREIKLTLVRALSIGVPVAIMQDCVVNWRVCPLLLSPSSTDKPSCLAAFAGLTNEVFSSVPSS